MLGDREICKGPRVSVHVCRMCDGLLTIYGSADATFYCDALLDLSDFQIALVLLDFCEQFGEVCGFGLLWNRHNHMSSLLVSLGIKIKLPP